MLNMHAWGSLFLGMSLYLLIIDQQIPRPVDVFLRERFEFTLLFIRMSLAFIGGFWIIS